MGCFFSADLLRYPELEHKQKLVPGFTKKYKITQLVYYEETPDVKAAIAREKQIKGWVRSKRSNWSSQPTHNGMI